MNEINNSFINFQQNLLEKNNEKIELNKNKDDYLYINKDSKDNVFHSNYNENIFYQNNLEEQFFEEFSNTIYMYYYSTIHYFKRFNYNRFKIHNSKNFIPKLKINKFLNDNYKIRDKNKNIHYNDNYSLNQNKSEDLKQNLQNSKNKLNNANFFEPNTSLTKKNLKNNENENESFSTSDKTSPTFSEKMEKTTNFFSLDKKTDKNVNLNEDEYLIEMFGKKGWICILCNNFNYETRVKCNRCGVIKKPKSIMKKKIKNECKKYDLKERCNKKGDWICSNCNNLNYSFRIICNRCKFPKINYYAINPINPINQITPNNENIINNNNMHLNCISPTFIVFNNIPNIFINNYEQK